SQSTSNFNGTYTFSSLDIYQGAEMALAAGATGADLAAMNLKPTQFTLSAGTPLSSVSQWDVGVYAQDDWRLRPNLTLSYGLRYETQNNIRDHLDWAPRVGFAWAPRAKTGKPS